MDRLRVLVISRDGPLVARLRMALGGEDGPEVKVISGGERARAAATTPGFDAILIDPWAGLSLAELALLLAENTGRLPVLAVSAEYPTAVATVLFGLGVTDYLSLDHHADAFPAVLAALTRIPVTNAPHRAAPRRARLRAPSA